MTHLLQCVQDRRVDDVPGLALFSCLILELCPDIRLLQCRACRDMAMYQRRPNSDAIMCFAIVTEMQIRWAIEVEHPAKKRSRTSAINNVSKDTR